jgi:transcription antitermination factor NusG
MENTVNGNSICQITGPQWFVAYTIARSEKKVYDRLLVEGFECYMPTYTTMKQWSDRKKKVQLPLFTSYVFVRITESKLANILKIPGVVKIVYYLGRPAIVRQKEIDSIKEFLQQTEGYRIKVKIGDKVEISSGVMQGVFGEVVRIGKTKVVIQIEQLGLSLVATIPRSQLQKPLLTDK